MPESFGDVKPQCPILLTAARVGKGRSYRHDELGDGVSQQSSLLLF
jgi:hypothetical protein